MTLSKKSVAAVLAAAIGAGAVLPAASMAATTTTVKQTKTYNIKVDQGVLTNGASHVKAKVVVTNPNKAVKDWYSRATIAKVVRKGVNNGIQKPYNSQGYRCVPVLNGSMNASSAKFTCKLQGADVPTTVKITYTANFLPPTA
jgi:hypothetical protein